MSSELSMLLACVASRLVIFGLDRLDMRIGDSMPLQVAVLVLSLITSIVPLLAIRFGWVEQSAGTVIIAGVAFFYFSALKRHRFIQRLRQRAAERQTGGGN